MWWLLAGIALADEPEVCHFEKPVTVTELREEMQTCVLPVGSVITIQIEESLPQEKKSGIGFHGNDSALTSNGQATLDGVASLLILRKKMNIRVVGYADGQEQGDLLDLSLRRAQRAAEYLIQMGIDPARISVEAAGADKPVDTTDTAEGHSRNRRVEFVVSVP